MQMSKLLKSDKTKTRSPITWPFLKNFLNEPAQWGTEGLKWMRVKADRERDHAGLFLCQMKVRVCLEKEYDHSLLSLKMA